MPGVMILVAPQVIEVINLASVVAPVRLKVQLGWVPAVAPLGVPLLKLKDWLL